jgi:hypothetical protein
VRYISGLGDPGAGPVGGALVEDRQQKLQRVAPRWIRASDASGRVTVPSECRRAGGHPGSLKLYIALD